jgi:uncharacterized protein YjhX (UPF0386 family)
MAHFCDRGIWQTHPLFRLIWAHAFSPEERQALSIYEGKTIAMEQLQPQKALNLAVVNGWKPVTNKLLAHCADRQIETDMNEILCAASREGHIAAMREARTMGATNFDWALGNAAKGGHIAAMREARTMGATDFNWALGNAAQGGHIAAMREARSMGATDFTIGATDFNLALAYAAMGGHVAAMHEARAMGAMDFNWALHYAAQGGHIEAMREEAHSAIFARITYTGAAMQSRRTKRSTRPTMPDDTKKSNYEFGRQWEQWVGKYFTSLADLADTMTFLLARAARPMSLTSPRS